MFVCVCVYVCMCMCMCMYVLIEAITIHQLTYSLQPTVCHLYCYCFNSVPFVLVLYTGIVYQYCILVILIIQCDQWCASVNEFTEYPPSTDTTSADRATEQIDQTDSLMKQMSQKNLNALRELGSCLPEKDVKKPVTKTIQKLVTYMYMYEREKNH